MGVKSRETYLQYDLDIQLSQLEKVFLTPLTSEVTVLTSEVTACRTQRETTAAMMVCKASKSIDIRSM